jgi:hypothetical protein
MDCSRCQNRRWVCEDHPLQPWDVDGDGCNLCGGAGDPCPDCNPRAPYLLPKEHADL